MTLLNIIILLLTLVGVFFMLVGAVGVLRLPDIYARMHAAAKPSTLGVSCLLLSAGLYHGEGSLFRMVVLIILFFITAPIATTTMARAAYRTDARRRFILNYDEMTKE